MRQLLNQFSILLIIFFCVSFFAQATENDKKVEVEIPPASPADREAVKPSNITGQDVIDLLHFAGVQLTEEQIRNLRALTPEDSEKIIALNKEQEEKILKLTKQQKEDFIEMTTEEKIALLGLTENQRQKLRKQSQQDIMLTNAFRQAQSRTYGGTFMHQVKGFHLESLVFYSAMGASMAAGAYMDSIKKGSAVDWTGLNKGGRADPRWMETLIHEMTSPVGLFSFFCFVIASGQMNTLYSKWLTNNITFAKIPGTKKIPGAHKIPLGPSQNPKAVHSRLEQLRVNNALTGGWKNGIKYHTARRGRRIAVALGGQLGMAVGMMASNIVHELHFIFSQNPHSKPCWDELKPDLIFGPSDLKQKDGQMHCDLFFDQLGHTAYTWMPGIASLLSASLLSHFLVNQAYKGGFVTAQAGRHISQRVGQGFLKGAIIRTSSRIPLGALARGALWLVPVPVGKGVVKGAQFAGGGIRSSAQWLARQIKPGGRGHSFLNLFTFMLTDTWVTHSFWADFWTEKAVANDVTESMEELMKHHNVNYTTSADTNFLDCEENGDDCNYHESVFSAHKMGLSFDRWRQFRTQIAMTAHQNWYKYVSETLASYEHAQKVYKDLFIAQKEKSFFRNMRYFGEVKETTAQCALQQMLQTLDEYILNHNLTQPEALNLHVLSADPNRFLKPPEELRAGEAQTQEQRGKGLSFWSRFWRFWTREDKKTTDRIFTLRALLTSAHSAECENPESLSHSLQVSSQEGKVQPNAFSTNLAPPINSLNTKEIPIEIFYGDKWDEALQAEKEKILKYENPENILREHFAELEQLFDIANLVAENSSYTIRQKIDNITQMPLTLVQKIKSLEDKINKDEIIYNKDLPQALTSYFALTNIPEDYFITQTSEETNIDLEKLWDDYSTETNQEITHIQSEQKLRDGCAIWWPTYFSKWKTWLTEQKQNILASSEELLNHSSITEVAKERLRKKAQAGTVEYLKWIIEAERLKKRLPAQINRAHNQHLTEKTKAGLPQSALSAYYQLGTDNIFAQLYEQTFINKASENNAQDFSPENPYIEASTPENQYRQINPQTPGMNYVNSHNQLAKVKEEGFDIELHPKRLKLIRTNGIMDFFVASALCGPDLSKTENNELLQKYRNLLDSKEEDRKAFDILFPDESADELMKKSPVFDQWSNGTNPDFYPPRITTIDEKTRGEICSGLHSQNTAGILENIYDGHFPVGDKVYSNLLHLVIDHIGLTEVSSLEEFNTWWIEKVEPYYLLFIFSADREYKRIVKNEFMTPLFDNKVTDEDVSIGSKVISANSGSYQSVLDNTKTFDLIQKKGWMEEGEEHNNTAPNHLYNWTSLGKMPDHKLYSLDLHNGVFKNLHFEALYWAGVILHYAKKTEYYSSDQDLENLKQSLTDEDLENLKQGLITDEDLENLKKSLTAFAEGFNTETVINIAEKGEYGGTTKMGFQKTQCGQTDCRYYWAKKFIEQAQESIGLPLLLGSGVGDQYVGIAGTLKIDYNSLLGGTKPGSDQTAELNEERLKKMQREAVGVFSCETNTGTIGPSGECEMVSVPRQILQYSVIRLNQMLEEGVMYANLIGYITEHPDVISATNIAQ